MIRNADTFEEIPLADAGSLSTEGVSDMQSGFEVDRLPNPAGRIRMLIHLTRVPAYHSCRLAGDHHGVLYTRR